MLLSSLVHHPQNDSLLAASIGCAAGIGLSLFLTSIDTADSKEKLERQKLKLEAQTEYLQWKAMGRPKLPAALFGEEEKKEDEKGMTDMRKLFQKMDLDSDGKIDKVELRAFLDKVGDVALNKEASGFTGKLATFVGIPVVTGVISPTKYGEMKLENLLDTLMDKYDINKDKALDEYEFWSLCNEYLASYLPMRLAACP